MKSVEYDDLCTGDKAIVDKLRREVTTDMQSRQLLEACKMAYRKHHLDDQSIGWDELSKFLLNALCNAMGDEGFQEWLTAQKEGRQDTQKYRSGRRS